MAAMFVDSRHGHSSPEPWAAVCLVRRHNKLLLQRRAADRIWAGRLNGPGGKVNPGETAATSIQREVAEETSLQIIDPDRRGTLELVLGSVGRSRLTVAIFVADSFHGRPRGGGEGRLRWYAINRLPFGELWPDMRYWLPIVLDGGSVNGQCFYDETGADLISCSLDLRWPAAQ